MNELSGTGQIAPDGMMSEAYITETQVSEYNASLSAVQSASFIVDMGAQQFLDTNRNTAQEVLGETVNSYVSAAGQVIKAVELNNLAQQAASTQDTQKANAVQNYITENSPEITEGQRIEYNQSLDNVEVAAQTFAAYTAASSSEEFVATLNSEAYETQGEFASIEFNGESVNVEISYADANIANIQSFNVSGYFVAAQDVLNAGEQGGFYTTGPTANSCFFAQTDEERLACENSGG